MNITIVPNRNAIFLSLAFGLAAAHGFNSVAAAFHGGDHFITLIVVQSLFMLSARCSRSHWMAFEKYPLIHLF